jgi:ABC-type antimicrobial peptide transport system permease subunit
MPVLAGALLGVGLALAMSRLLGSLLYEVSPTDPVIYVGIAILLLAVAFAASVLPARRATRIDPLTALRGE